MSKRYLVIETHIISHKDKQFMHFIDLQDDLLNDIDAFIGHLYWFRHQTVDKVYFRDTKLSNW